MGHFIPPPFSVALTMTFVATTFLLFVVIPLAVSAPVDKLQSCEPPKPPDCYNVCGNTMFYLSSKDTCDPCISCPAGQEPNTYCGDLKGHGENATCDQCKPGFFSTDENQLKCKQCFKCTHDRRRVERQCTATSDTECGGCIEGYGTHPYYAGTEHAQFCFTCAELHPNISSQQESCLATPQTTTKSSALQPTTKSYALQPTTKFSAPDSSAHQPTIESSVPQATSKPSSTPKKKHHHPEEFTLASGRFRALNEKQSNIDEELSLEEVNLSPANKTGIIIGATFVLIVLIIAVASQNPNCLNRLGKPRSTKTGHCHFHRNGCTEISTKQISSCTCNTGYMPIRNVNGHLNQTLYTTPSSSTPDSLNVQSVVKHDNNKPFCQLQPGIPEPLDVQTMSTQFKKFIVDSEVKLGATPTADDGTFKPLDSLGGILSRYNDSLYTEVRGSLYQPEESSSSDRPRACAPEHDSALCEKVIGAQSFRGDHLISNSHPTGNPPMQEENPNEPKLRVVASEQPEHNSASCEKAIGVDSFPAEHLNRNLYPTSNHHVQENNSKLASKPEESQEMQYHRHNERESLRPIKDENKDPEQARSLVKDQNVIFPHKQYEDLQSDNKQQQQQQQESQHRGPPSPPGQQQSSEHQNRSVLKAGSHFYFHGAANFLGPIYINNHGLGADGVSGISQAPHVQPPSTSSRESPDGYVIRQCTDENSEENKLP